MTTVQKAEAYDRALEYAKSALDCLADDYICNHLTKDDIRGMYAKLFHELGESEDESKKIQKALINIIECAYKRGTIIFGEKEKEKYIAWLKKQGKIAPTEDELEALRIAAYEPTKNWSEKLQSLYEKLTHCEQGVQKPVISYDALMEGIGHYGITQYQIDNWLKKYIDVEKQGEQNLADNAEPKFKVGDWCIDNEDGTIFQIVKVLDNTYTYKTNEGKEYSGTTHYSLENDARLWTIQDAKDGDVLATLDYILIFKKLLKNDGGISYCHYDFGAENPQFIWLEDKNWYFGKEAIIHPATKEQCDLLFQKMKEDGYEWDAEKKAVQNLADKAEPKFHEGDWVVQGYNILKIKCVGDTHYCYETVGGYVDDMLVSEIDSQFHLWTIQDAKDGDVLACNEEILLFKSYSVQGRVSLYCWYNGRTNNFHSKEVKDTLLTTRNKICPATKEQRDTLMKAMTERGYEWDSENKGLKKIEQKPVVIIPKFRVGDEVVAENEEPLTITRIDEKGYWSNDLFICDFDSECIWDLVEQTPTWSEADELQMQGIINLLPGLTNRHNWLKSLKERVQSQPKQEWSEEDEKMLNDILMCGEHHCYLDAGNIAWLKSLRPRKQWKPSEEQMKALDIAIRRGIQLGTWEEVALKSLVEQLKQL